MLGKLSAVCLLTTAISACGGSSENEALTPFSEISGIWNASFVDENSSGMQILDEQYNVIRTDGLMLGYDYAGDGFGTQEAGTILNCYETFPAVQLTPLGDNRFSVESDGEISTLTLTDENNVSIDNSDGTRNWRRQATLVENNLAPLCNIVEP